LVSSTSWKDYEKCKFEVTKRKYLFRLKMKESCIKNAKDWDELKQCKETKHSFKFKGKQCEKCKHGE